MEKEEATADNAQYTDWNALIKKKFRHEPEMAKLDLLELVKKYEKFIYLKAGHFARYSKGVGSLLELEDIASFGREGLLDALKGYDSKFGVKFLTYAGRYITGYMHKGIDNSAPLGRYGLKKSRDIKKAMTKLKREGIENPSYEDISKASGLSTADVKNTIEDTSIHITSLDNLLSQDGNSGETLVDIIPDTRSKSELYILQNHDSELGQVSQAIISAGLSERESNILKLHVMDGKNYSEIDKRLNLTNGRTSQYMAKIAIKLRASRFFSEELSKSFPMSQN